MHFQIVVAILLLCAIKTVIALPTHSGAIQIHRTKYNHIASHSRSFSATLGARRISPNPEEGENMEEYRKALLRVLKDETSNPNKFEGQDLLQLIVQKWGVAYDLQLRKAKPFGDASKNIYINVMWRYYGQRSFPMSEREYMEHLEAIARYLKAIDKVNHFKEKVEESRKRPNAYFGYAVGIPLDVDPDSADAFFKGLSYE